MKTILTSLSLVFLFASVGQAESRTQLMGCTTLGLTQLRICGARHPEAESGKMADTTEYDLCMRSEGRRLIQVHGASARCELSDNNSVIDRRTPVALTKKFVPRKKITSNGKAFTECQDAREQQQSFRGRQICVNAKGEYYFLSD